MDNVDTMQNGCREVLSSKFIGRHVFRNAQRRQCEPSGPMIDIPKIVSSV